MFELLAGAAIVAVIIMTYRTKRVDRQLSEERTAADRAADMCSRCTDYDCLVSCEERRAADRRAK